MIGMQRDFSATKLPQRLNMGFRLTLRLRSSTNTRRFAQRELLISLTYGLDFIRGPRVVTLPKPVQPKATLDWQPTIDRETYNAAIAQIKDHIAEGRTYQVNYTMRLQTDFKGNAWDFFLHLAQSQNNHAAYVDTGRYVICSASPELFFQLEGDTITCRPMKGTVKRGRTTMEDREQSEWLKSSAKNRAENVMIVDMVRNDLGASRRLVVSAFLNYSRPNDIPHSGK